MKYSAKYTEMGRSTYHSLETDSPTYWKTKTMFMTSTTTDSRQITIFWNTPFLNSPMTTLLELKQRAGRMANGNWMDITAFRMSFKFVNVCISVNPAINRV